MTKAFWATLGLAGALLMGTSRAQDDVSKRPTISVSGEGKISAAPDVAEITVGVITEAESASGAMKANNEAMANLQEVLRQRGVAAKDMQTTNLSVQPRYSQPVAGPGGNVREFVPKIVGYTVTNNVSITARNLEKLGELLDGVVSAGANQMYGISFRIEESDKLMDEARKRAVGDARRKAELLAGESGMVLGKPLQISEAGGYTPPQPMFRAAPMMAAEAAVPVAQGEVDLSVTVQIVYELRSPE